MCTSTESPGESGRHQKRTEEMVAKARPAGSENRTPWTLLQGEQMVLTYRSAVPSS